MVNLPREVWDHIAEQLDHVDLLNLALVSRLHVWVCRRLLVRKLILDHDFGRWQQPLSLIRKYDLSRSVRDLTIRNFSTIRDLEAARSTRKLFATLAPSGLRSLAIINTSLYFANAPLESNNPFAAELMKISPLLTSIKLSSISSLEDLMEDDLPVSNLRHIGWDSRATGSLTPAFFLLIQGSAATVTHLSVIFTDHIGHAENYNHLFALDLPSLIFLMLGPGDQSLIPSEESPDLSPEQRLVQVNFTQFLIRHPCIIDLSLDRATQWIDWKFTPRTLDGALSSSYLRFDPQSLPTNILPNLVALTASPANIAVLAEGHADLLHRLQRLFISANDDDDQEGMLDMFSSLDTYSFHTSPFPTPELALPTSCNDPAGGFMADILSGWTGQSANTFPSLEKLAVLTISLDVDNFPRFLLLRELVCVWRPDKFRKSDAEIIGNRCPSLEVIRFEDPDVTYRIIRGATGGTSQAMAEAADPMDIEEAENSDDSEDYGVMILNEVADE